MTKKTTQWIEYVVSAETGAVRGNFAIKKKGDTLYALIAHRWCRVERRDDGKLVEIWRDR